MSSILKGGKSRGTGLMIADLKIGESGYAFPWAMRVDTHDKAFLNAGYAIQWDKGHIVTLGVRRNEHGWHADISGCDYIWRPEPVGCRGELPVATIEGGQR